MQHPAECELPGHDNFSRKMCAFDGKCKSTFLHRTNSTAISNTHDTQQKFLTNPNTHTHPFNGPLSGTTQVSQYQKGQTNLDFMGPRDSEWQWHQLGNMQVCTLFQTDNHASTSPLSFLQAGCPSCHPTNSVKALKVTLKNMHTEENWFLFYLPHGV